MKLRHPVVVLALLSASWPVVAAPAADGEAAAPTSPPVAMEEGFVTTPDGVDIHYVAAGEGASILFVPGWTLSGEIWQPQLDHFAAGHRVVAMDPRSQGRSSQPRDGHYPEARGRDVKAVVDQLGLAPSVLVCWSLAVAECVSYVEQFGTGSLRGLALVDGLAGGEPDPVWMPRMVQWIGSLQRDRRTGTASFIASMYQTPQAPEYLARMTEISLATPTDAMTALMVGGLTADLRSTLPKIDKPTLLAVTESPFLARYEEMRDLIPGVRWEVFDAGHALFVDQPERFNRLLGELLSAADGVAAGAAAAAPSE
jgi:microsomal epoxide hydrolase